MLRILTLSGAPWDDCNSVGNTYSNLLGGLPNVKLYNMYSREKQPYNQHCTEYYTVTIGDIVRHFWCPWKIGRRFSQKCDLIVPKDSSSTIENAGQGFKGWKRNLVLFVVDCVYNTKIWLNHRAKDFINEANPDIVFCFAIADSYRFQILQYIKKHSKAKIFLFVVDDVYWNAKRSNTLLSNIEVHRYHKLFNIADKVYGISDLMCKAYSEEFSIKMDLLTKGCDIKEPRERNNNVTKIVYAGNLLYGRDKVLGFLAKAIESCNKRGQKAKLFIFTSSHISLDTERMLNIEGASEICGSRSYSDIKKILETSDIVLQVESFNDAQKKIVRYSFSTKITDCLQSGATMMVIGPEGISSVEFCRKIPGSIVIDNIENIQDVLTNILEHPINLRKRALLTNEFAREHFDINKIQNRLLHDFLQ